VNSAKKIIIIGIDGGTLKLVTPWAQNGYLPNLKKLMDQGYHGTLYSTIHPVTAPAWTSFLTGANPGKHGIYDFFLKETSEYKIRYATAQDRKIPTIYELLDRNGIKAGVINVPMTYPPENLENGFIIPGLGTPGTSSNFSSPKAIYEEVVDRFGPYSVLNELNDSSRDGYVRNLLGSTEQLGSITEYLLKKHNPPFLMVVFNASDFSQHHFWHYMDPTHPLYRDDARYSNVIRNVYGKIDEGIGAIMAAIDSDTNIIVMSDHGAGPAMGYLNINKWLEEAGLLRYKNNNTTSLLREVRLSMRKYLPKSIKYTMEKYLSSVKNLVDSKVSFHNIDMSKTVAFAHGVYGNIFLNIRGRDKEGVLDLSDRPKAVRDISDGLNEIKDPHTGEQIVERVYEKEECYHGPHIDYAPDLLIPFTDYKYYTCPSVNTSHKKVFMRKFEGENIGELESFSYHRLDGMFILYGEGIRQGICPDQTHITDIAPTVLHMLGWNIPDYMDGRVISEAFVNNTSTTENHRAADLTAPDKKESSSRLSNEDEEEMKKALKSLGYM
jgi:predicted AlkP superfamily phosphohydrolase/phosphomutase